MKLILIAIIIILLAVTGWQYKINRKVQMQIADVYTELGHLNMRIYQLQAPDKEEPNPEESL